MYSIYNLSHLTFKYVYIWRHSGLVIKSLGLLAAFSFSKLPYFGICKMGIMIIRPFS